MPSVDESIHRRKLGPTSYLETGSGRPILLVHGLHATASYWTGVAEALGQRFRVIAPDLLGFGESDSPSADGYMEEQAHALFHLLRGLQVDRLHVGAHDFGGPVVMTLMRLHPGLQVEGVVLSNTNMFTDTYVPPPLRTAGVPIIGSLVYRVMAGSRFGLRMTYQMAVARKDKVSYAQFSQEVDARNLRITQEIFERSLADLPGNYRDVDLQLHKTRAPVLVLWGDKDPFFALSVGHRTARSAPSGLFQAIHGAGHFPALEDPPAFAGAVIERFGSAPGAHRQRADW